MARGKKEEAQACTPSVLLSMSTRSKGQFLRQSLGQFCTTPTRVCQCDHHLRFGAMPCTASKGDFWGGPKMDIRGRYLAPELGIGVVVLAGCVDPNEDTDDLWWMQQRERRESTSLGQFRVCKLKTCVGGGRGSARL